MTYKLTYIIVFIIYGNLFAQNYLSNLNAGDNAIVYTTYASSIESSKFTTDIGYQLTWFDPEKNIMFESEQSGSLGLFFISGNQLKSRLGEFTQAPVITTSYSNLVKLFCRPFPWLKAEYSAVVKTSESLLLEVSLTNESSIEKTLEVLPFITDLQYSELKSPGNNSFSFIHRRTADSWMKEHKIPYVEKLHNLFTIDRNTSVSGEYKLNNQDTDTLYFTVKISLPPGKSETLRIIRSVSEDPEFSADKTSFAGDFSDYISANEKLYKNVPLLKFNNDDHRALYWNAFNLMRQCMMAPEGKSSYNYYVFSREPKWGWGYGGQVFHESLTMLAYAYLDPVSAMNSQRVYLERQHPDGYINYRTGPYLDEQIPTNGQLTSSAPWFNWQNYEIYLVTGDKKFLKEAYESGKKFFNYYTKNRDKDGDGLCEWGSHAELESVRDARVAVWDEVGSPDNFESVDCNLMLVKEAKSLAQMAEILGLLDDAAFFRKDANKRSVLINNFMWDDSTGFYYNVNRYDHTFTFKNRNDLKRKEIISFLALWAGVCDDKKAERLIEHFRNPSEFYRKFGVPTLSADDPYYNPIGYWNGPVWLPWQYLVFRGLLDYGYHKDAEDLVERISKNVAYQLKTNHYFWEFYSADDLQAGWNKTYIWSGIIARFFIDLQMKY